MMIDFLPPRNPQQDIVRHTARQFGNPVEFPEPAPEPLSSPELCVAPNYISAWTGEHAAVATLSESSSELSPDEHAAVATL